MSTPLHNTSLSSSARLLCYLGPPSAILITAVASPRAALLSPFAFLPTAWFYKKWQKSNNANPSRHGELEPLVWTYAAGGTIGLGAVALVQMIVCGTAAAILFGYGAKWDFFWAEFQRSDVTGLTADELRRRAELAFSWRNWVFNGILSFVAAGISEETLKYIPIFYASRQGSTAQRKQRTRSYIDYAVACALSFGVVENIGFFYVACEEGHETWSKFALTFSERMILGSFAHALAAALTALRATRRDYYRHDMSWWRVVGPAMLLHGAFDFVAFSSSALEGNVGWIHPTGFWNAAITLGILGSLVGTAAWMVKREWKIITDYDREPR